MELLDLVERTARDPDDVPEPQSWAPLRDQWRPVEQDLDGRLARGPDAARPLVEAYEQLAQQCGEPEALGRAARLRGSWFAQLGRFRESVSPYREALDHLRGAARDGARLGLASALVRCGEWDEAAGACRAARASARRRGDGPLAAAAAFSLGLAHHEAGVPEQALRPYRTALGEFEGLGDPVMTAATRDNLANALVLLDRFGEAEPLYAQAAEAFGEAGLEHPMAYSRYNRGALLVATDRLGEAEGELLAAEEALARLGEDERAALARVDRGEALLRARLLPEAIRVLTGALRDLGESAPPGERARTRLLLARAHIVSGDGAAARELLSRPARMPGPALEAERIELRGRAFAAEGRHALARRRLEDAADRFGRDRPVGRIRCRSAAAWCALEDGDVEGASQLARAAERDASSLDVPSCSFAASAVRFLAEDERGNRRAASTALERAFEALERVRRGLGPDAMRAALLTGSERWFARAVRHVLAGNDGGPKALALLERWRARALVDLLGSAERIRDGDAEVRRLRASLAALERRLDEPAGPGFLRSRSERPDSELLAALGEAERRYVRAVRRRRRAGFERPFDLQRFCESVPNGTLVVSLFADDRGGVAFTTGDDVRVVDGLCDRPGVGALIEELDYRLGKFALGREFAQRQQRRLAAETQRLLERVAHTTLAPLAEQIAAAERLVIVPEGPWHRVPFAALPFAGGRLADRLPVSLAPALASLRNGVPRANGRPVVLAAADERTPFIEDEGRRVAEALGTADLFVGEEARSDVLRKRRRPRCVHVASHGRFRRDAPSLSGVRLADGWLRAIDFRSLPLEGSLVVLSGCDTGVARPDAGGEVQGLVRGVLSSGAAEVLVSLWAVDDTATARFMARFHELRAEGGDSASALARTQAEGAARGEHPWYWAGFSLWSRRMRR